MNWRDIPESLDINGERWRVAWRDSNEPAWRVEECWGRTAVNGERLIELCSRLKYMPEMLAAVWLHEIMHAAFSDTFENGWKSDPNRPKGFTRAMEETIVQVISQSLAAVLNQTGWEQVL